jgi:hypothetical protein
MSISASKQFLQIAKRNLSNFDENSVILIRIEILRRSKAHSTLFYTPNVVHVDFSIEISARNRKTQSFKFRRKLCYFVPDWDTTAFKRSFHSILHAEYTAYLFQCRIPANRKTQSFKFRRKLCYFDPDWETTPFKRFFHSSLHAELTACSFQRRNNPCISQNAISQISTKALLFLSGLRYYAI